MSKLVFYQCVNPLLTSTTSSTFASCSLAFSEPAALLLCPPDPPPIPLISFIIDPSHSFSTSEMAFSWSFSEIGNVLSSRQGHASVLESTLNGRIW